MEGKKKYERRDEVTFIWIENGEKEFEWWTTYFCKKSITKTEFLEGKLVTLLSPLFPPFWIVYPNKLYMIRLGKDVNLTFSLLK